MSLLTGIAAYWKCDENGTVNITDSVAGIVLTNNGSTPVTTGGKINDGINFGSVNVTQYFNGSNGLGITNGAISMSAWINLVDPILNTSMSIAYHGDSSTDVKYYLTYFYGGGTTFQLIFSRERQGVTEDRAQYNFSSTLAGSFHFVTGTYDGATLLLYLDNVQVASGSGSGNGSSSITTEVAIGARATGTSLCLGKIDEVGFWSRAISSTEVGQLWNGGSGLQYPFGLGVNSNFFEFM